MRSTSCWARRRDIKRTNARRRRPTLRRRGGKGESGVAAAADKVARAIGVHTREQKLAVVEPSGGKAGKKKCRYWCADCAEKAVSEASPLRVDKAWQWKRTPERVSRGESSKVRLCPRNGKKKKIKWKKTHRLPFIPRTVLTSKACESSVAYIHLQ